MKGWESLGLYNGLGDCYLEPATTGALNTSFLASRIFQCLINYEQNPVDKDKFALEHSKTAIDDVIALEE